MVHLSLHHCVGRGFHTIAIQFAPLRPCSPGSMGSTHVHNNNNNNTRTMTTAMTSPFREDVLLGEVRMHVVCHEDVVT